MKILTKTKVFLSLLGIWLVFTGVVHGEVFRVLKYIPSAPPYYFGHKDARSGIYVDLLSEISKITNDEFRYKYYPPLRGQIMFEKNKMDIEPGINPKWRQHSKTPGVYTIPFTEVVDIVLFRPGKRISVKSPDDLRGKSVGMIRGFIYPAFTKAFQEGVVKQRLNSKVELLFKQLEVGRFDQIFIDRNTALYWMKVRSQYRSFEVGDEIGREEIMFRLHPSKSHTLERLNNAIKKLKDSGKIEKILAKYQ